MADKYIKQQDGVFTEKEALVESTGAADAGNVVALDDQGRLDESVMPVGIGADTSVVASSENLAAGDFVNIHNVDGTANCRKADATTNGKHAHGYVLEAVTAPANATVYHEGPNNQVTGATPGDVYLSTTPGGFTSTPPAVAGNVIQKLGVATSATSINAELGQRIVLA